MASIAVIDVKGENPGLSYVNGKTSICHDSNNGIVVEYKFDDQPAQTAGGFVIPQGNAVNILLFVFNKGNLIPALTSSDERALFLSNLESSNRVVIKTRDDCGEVVVNEFDITGTWRH